MLEVGKAFSNRFGLRDLELFQFKINPLAFVPILLVSVILLLCALSCIGNWMPRFVRRQYLPISRLNSVSGASVLNMQSPFRFQHWSPVNSGDGRSKMPLSPKITDSQQSPFGLGHGLDDNNGGIELMKSSSYPSASNVSHSYSSNSLGQMQFENSNMGAFWSSYRSQMHLQSRRSQSREDLNSSLAEVQNFKS